MEEKKASGTLDVLRKRLFIAAAYLLVVAGLLAYVSYGQYRINIEVKVNMPTAATFEASLVLSPNETAARGYESVRQLWLAGLAPGDDALQFAKKDNPWGNDSEADTADTDDTDTDGTDTDEPDTEENNHRIELTVRNWYMEETAAPTGESNDEGGDDEGGEPTTEKKVIAETPLKYNVRINGTGCLPLEFVLVEKTEDGAIKYYQSKVTVDNDTKERSYKFYEITEENETSTEEAELELGGGPKEKEDGTIELPEVEKTVYLYVGWQKTAESSQDDNMVIKDYDSGAYRKEVERLEIRTVMTGKDVGHEILDETDLIETIEGKDSKYGIYYKPGQSTSSPDSGTTPEPKPEPTP